MQFCTTIWRQLPCFGVPLQSPTDLPTSSTGCPQASNPAPLLSTRPRHFVSSTSHNPPSPSIDLQEHPYPRRALNIGLPPSPSIDLQEPLHHPHQLHRDRLPSSQLIHLRPTSQPDKPTTRFRNSPRLKPPTMDPEAPKANKDALFCFQQYGEFLDETLTHPQKE
ncbi:hypothetical protein BJ508DRAFT_163222 [Ascobolus immersus RN42]|uniref:Uncharacterized protein n=1 Tax=Ascobolus immersus RN42 TaxID=1160509 RepID=A0A3N4HXF8_ASCIM|nr:hypothetical protein BJ508DRAFT_163222 [Ascobolus immersus RN42]